MNISNFTLYIVKLFVGSDTRCWPIFVDFQDEVAGLRVNNSINKNMKLTFMVS